VGNSKTIFASQAQSEARDRSPGQSRHLDAERRTLEAMEADTLADELARQLRDSEARYNHLFGHAPVAFQQMDRDGIVRRANQAAGQLLRCRPDQLMGRHAWDFVPPAERESFRVALLGRLATGVETPPFECDYLLEDGSRLTIEVHETIVRNAAGEVTGAEAPGRRTVRERHVRAGKLDSPAGKFAGDRRKGAGRQVRTFVLEHESARKNYQVLTGHGGRFRGRGGRRGGEIRRCDAVGRYGGLDCPAA